MNITQQLEELLVMKNELIKLGEEEQLEDSFEYIYAYINDNSTEKSLKKYGFTVTYAMIDYVNAVHEFEAAIAEYQTIIDHELKE